MKRFLLRIISFALICLIIGEIICRVFVVNSEVPQRQIDKYGIQKYKPFQSGYYQGRSHKWNINEFGWPGTPPKSYNNLVTIIGDSYIENFMNPNECHQASYLQKLNNKYNYLEAARSGVSFIEAMEISKQLDSLNPTLQLIYLNESDFEESILQLGEHKDITQINIEEGRVLYGEMKSPRLKKILYNLKFIHYLYRRFPFKANKKNTSLPKDVVVQDSKYILYDGLLDFIKINYKIEDKILVFRPNTDVKTVELCRKMGFRIIILEIKNNRSWSLEYDPHWSCYGHEEAAKQVSSSISSF